MFVGFDVGVRALIFGEFANAIAAANLAAGVVCASTALLDGFVTMVVGVLRADVVRLITVDGVCLITVLGVFLMMVVGVIGFASAVLVFFINVTGVWLAAFKAATAAPTMPCGVVQTD